MNINELLSTTPENLADKQFNAVKEHAIQILEKVISHLKKDEFEEVKSMTNFSPSGDGMGCDNSFIDFKLNSDDKDGTDICQVIDILKSLNEIKGKKRKGN